ncbi:MAG TPA: hypothetical protein VKR38_05935 [Usitatibacter sp.]|nr:hypothetical protein [Usitatibacter sp.]
MIKKKLLSIGVVACGLSFNLGAEAPSGVNVFFGAPETLVVAEPAPVDGKYTCTGNPESEATECWAQYQAVLVARLHKAHRHGSWT